MAKWTVCGVSVFTLCAVFLLFAEPGHGNQCTRCWPASLFNRVMDCKDIYTGCILLMTPKNWAGIVREVKVFRCEVRIEGGGSLAMVRDRMGNLCKAFKAQQQQQQPAQQQQQPAQQQQQPAQQQQQQPAQQQQQQPAQQQQQPAQQQQQPAQQQQQPAQQQQQPAQQQQQPAQQQQQPTQQQQQQPAQQQQQPAQQPAEFVHTPPSAASTPSTSNFSTPSSVEPLITSNIADRTRSKSGIKKKLFKAK
eukprot:XP_011440737.1 PREDICTED: putative uncharacterized protein DDB_G0271606 [Crassostrea gigas]